MKQSPEEEMQKGKWLSEKALQIAEKRREVKGKGEKGRYIHLNGEFQRIARRDKKAFLSDQPFSCATCEFFNDHDHVTYLTTSLLPHPRTVADMHS